MDPVSPPEQALRTENAALRARLEEAEEALRAIRDGEVDALVVEGPAGPQIFTLQGLDAESNRFREGILAQVSDAVVAVDGEHRITYLNAAAERQYGVAASEVLGRSLSGIYESRWIRPGDEAVATTALGERGEWRGENVHVTRDGRELQVESSVTVMRDRDGAPIGLLAVIRDITERKRAEEALHEGDERFRVLANAIPQLAWIARPDGHIFWYNRRWYDYTGTAPEQMEGWGWQSVHDAAELPKVLDRWKNSIATGQHFEMTFPLRGADGIFRQFLTRVIPLKSVDGRVVLWFGTNTDVDTLTRTETALRESNERSRLATEATGVGIWEWNVLTNQIRWDVQMFRIHGIPPTADGFVPYSIWRATVLPEDLPGQEAILQDTIRRVGRSARAFRIRRADDGERRQIESVETVRRNDHGQPEWVVGTNLDVTERKRAEDALRESEARKNAILASALDAIIAMDHEGRIIDFNPAAEDIFGHARAAVLGKMLADMLIPERLRERHRQGLAHFLATGEGPVLNQQIQLPALRADGTEFPAEIAIIAIPGADPPMFTAFLRDITERKQAEAALIESERFNVAVLNSLPAEIAVLDREGNIIAVNKPWQDFANASAMACSDRAGVGINYLNVCREAAAGGDEVAQRTLDGIVHVIEGRTADFRMEYPCHAPDRQRWFSLHVVRPTAEVGGAVVAHMDITERRRAEELIMEQDSLLELIATGSPLDECLNALCTAISRLSPQTRACVFVAAPDRKRFSHSIAPDLAPDFVAGIASAPREEVGDGVCAAAALNGEAATCADIAADGRWSPTWQALCLTHGIRACHSAPVLDAEGHALAVLTLYFDEAREPSEWELGIRDFGTHLASIVLERDRADAALREALTAAEAANRSKDHFLAVLSHELRTPLTPVLLAVSELERDPDLRREVREDLAMVKRNVELETKLIDDLLDISRITTGKLPLNLESVDLNDTVRQVCEICLPPSGGARLECRPAEGVGTVRADPTRLQQVLWNVIRNAFKFTPEDGRVTVTTKRLAADRCEIRVSDSGIGIPPEALPRIFNAFDQADGVTRRFGGLGLGLAISKAIVELLGGSIRAESEGHGRGATFIIELPIEAARMPAPLSVHAPAAGAPAQALRLLLVEDHADTARTLSRLLRRAGFEVVTASDVASATVTAEREPFDILISDLGLPDGSGCDIMQRVRAKRLVPGIAMSGYGMTEDVRRSREAGFSEHLIKPINVQQLIAAIGRVTEGRPS